MKTVAVLIAAYNRKQTTLSCLNSLQALQLPGDVKLEIFLTDDASTDGTAQAVCNLYPQVHLLHGTGSLYWAGGMRYTWAKALESAADYYLLLNDDTLLQPDAVVRLLESAALHKHSVIIGATCDAHTGEASYGGWRLNSRLFWKSSRVTVTEQPQACDFGNANIMLVPATVVERVGILSHLYTHALADYDYGLRVRRAGLQVIAAPGYLGYCSDDHGRNWKSAKVSLRQRIAFLKSPKGLAYSEYLTFIKTHFPLSYPSAFVKLWAKTLLPGVWNLLKK